MSFSQSSALTIVPLISRLVLGAAFITAGWTKLMTTQTYQGAEAQKLIEMKWVADAGVSGPEIHRASMTWQGQRPSSSFSLVQDPPSEPDPAEAQPATPPMTIPPADKPDDAVEKAVEDVKEQVKEAVEDIPKPPTDEVTTDPTTGEAVVEAKALYNVALTLEKHQWPQPKTGAWIVAITELLGGALILIGLFSRIWALALAGIMVAAFYLTSFEPVANTSLIELISHKDYGHPVFNQVFRQLGLFALAFGVLLTGPGPVSLDRLLFRPEPKAEEDALD